jgi:NADH-quinone oxidoreductase subunit G
MQNSNISNIVKIRVDNLEIEAEEGANLLQTLLDNSIETPHFCYHEELGADGNCRMCMVEIEGQKRPQIACDTFVKADMVVKTESEKIKGVRRSILELELINHPVDCPICDQAGECKLQDYYMEVGLYESRLTTEKVHGEKHVDLGSSVVLDQERCVLCERCARFTKQYTKTHELGIIGRGDHARISTAPDQKLDNHYALNVVDLCPVGALTNRDFRFSQRVWFLENTKSVCQDCAKGCNIYIDHNQLKYREPHIYRYRPRKNREVNGHFMCDFGRLNYKNQNDIELSGYFWKGEKRRSDEVTGKVVKLLENERAVVVISPSLSNEQIILIDRFTKERNLPIFALGLEERDKDFGDDLLRSGERFSNGWSVRELGIESRSEKFLEELEKVSLVLNFNNSKLFEMDLGKKRRVDFATHPFRDWERSDAVLTFAPFSYTDGTCVNEDGVLQKFYSALQPTRDREDLIKLIHLIRGEGSSSELGVWESEIREIDIFKDIDFSMIPDEGIKLKRRENV